MDKLIRTVCAMMMALLLVCGAARAEEISREQIQGLDEQVQAVKSNVLSIAAELNQLEEKLLYPSSTEIALFVALAAGEKFRLDSLDLLLDGVAVTHHLYSFKELEALQKGGVQKIYTGNIRTGDHLLEVNLMGKSEGGDDIKLTSSYKIHKDVVPKIAEITLTSRTITFTDR